MELRELGSEAGSVMDTGRRQEREETEVVIEEFLMFLQERLRVSSTTENLLQN